MEKKAPQSPMVPPLAADCEEPFGWGIKGTDGARENPGYASLGRLPAASSSFSVSSGRTIVWQILPQRLLLNFDMLWIARTRIVEEMVESDRV